VHLKGRGEKSKHTPERKKKKKKKKRKNPTKKKKKKKQKKKKKKKKTKSGKITAPHKEQNSRQEKRNHNHKTAKNSEKRGSWSWNHNRRMGGVTSDYIRLYQGEVKEILVSWVGVVRGNILSGRNTPKKKPKRKYINTRFQEREPSQQKKAGGKKSNESEG